METMLAAETMHAAGRRRTLPPVPRASSGRAPIHPDAPTANEDGSQGDLPTQRFVVDFATGEQRSVSAAEEGLSTPETTLEDVPAELEDEPADGSDGADSRASSPESSLDAAQQFVARLRAAATDFAEAAGAASAVVREAVPPARHRRSRCRVVLRFADDTEIDVTFLGPTGLPGAPSRHGFDRQIRRWLGTGQRRDAAWLVPDQDSSDGVAVDVSAWLSAG